MAKVRPRNSNDTRPDSWHTKVWDFIEQHPGVAKKYEATKGLNGILDSSKLSDYDRAVVREAERRASE